MAGDLGGGAMSRRELLVLLAGATLAACSGTSHSGAGASSSPGSAGSATGSFSTVTASGGNVPLDAQIPKDEVASWRAMYAKPWLGKWRDDVGGSGTADGKLDIDLGTFTARAELSVSDGFLGAGSKVSPTVYVVDLATVDHNATSYAQKGTQLGDLEGTVDGPGAVTLTGTNISGHPDIDSIVLEAHAPTPAVVNVTYRIMRGATTTRGAMTWSSAGNRPDAPEVSAANSLTDFINGTYAASLLTAADLTDAMGVPMHAPRPNGGKAAFEAGIDVSNAMAVGDDPSSFVQYGIYRGSDAARADAYLQENASIATPIAGLGDGALFVTSGSFLVVRQGDEVANIQAHRDGADTAALEQAIAAKLLAKLGKH